MKSKWEYINEEDGSFERFRDLTYNYITCIINKRDEALMVDILEDIVNHPQEYDDVKEIVLLEREELKEVIKLGLEARKRK